MSKVLVEAVPNLQSALRLQLAACVDIDTLEISNVLLSDLFIPVEYLDKLLHGHLGLLDASLVDMVQHVHRLVQRLVVHSEHTQLLLIAFLQLEHF